MNPRISESAQHIASEPLIGGQTGDLHFLPICSASLSLLLSLASLSMVSIPLSLRALCMMIKMGINEIMTMFSPTVRQLWYFLNRGEHSSLDASPRRYSTLLVRHCSNHKLSIDSLSLYHFRKQESYRLLHIRNPYMNGIGNKNTL